MISRLDQTIHAMGGFKTANLMQLLQLPDGILEHILILLLEMHN